jgi:hypothetical protein
MPGSYTNPFANINGPVVIDPGPLSVNGNATVQGNLVTQTITSIGAFSTRATTGGLFQWAYADAVGGTMLSAVNILTSQPRWQTQFTATNGDYVLQPFDNAGVANFTPFILSRSNGNLQLTQQGVGSVFIQNTTGNTMLQVANPGGSSSTFILSASGKPTLTLTSATGVGTAEINTPVTGGNAEFHAFGRGASGVGYLIVGADTVSSNNAAAGIVFQRVDSSSLVNRYSRWFLTCKNQETGGNSGGNLVLDYFADNSTYLGTALMVRRSDGQFTVNGSGGIPRFAQTPVAGAVTPTHTFTLNLNGVNYRVPCLI